MSDSKIHKNEGYYRIGNLLVPYRSVKEIEKNDPLMEAARRGIKKATKEFERRILYIGNDKPKS